jgi:hypothetical protein
VRLEPLERVQREFCNSGYARGKCSRFPAETAADAVRFSAQPQGRLLYILEKDHAPLEHGEIDPEEDLREPLAMQAKAFAESMRSFS